MLRARLRRLRTSHSTQARFTNPTSWIRRAYHEYQHEQLPPVRALGPTLWCLATAGTIYLGCAVYEVRQDIKGLRKKPSTFDELEVAKMRGSVNGVTSRLGGGFASRAGLPELPEFSETEKLAVGAIALNTSLYATCSLVPGLAWHFYHVAASPYNYTLFTSMFGHAGLLHLGFNMFALYNVTAPVAHSRGFQGSGSHLAAFYLSSGVLASLADHLTTIWPNRLQRVAPSSGASGAIMALIGAFGMTYPHAQIGIMFIPGSLPAEQVLMGMAVFEVIGLFIGWPFLRLGHAAHLTGLACGASYIYFDGKRRLWRPTRKLAFNSMRLIKMV